MAESITKLAQGNGRKKETFTTRLGDVALEQVNKPKDDPSMYRADGSKKSPHGFLGPLTNLVTGGTMTEFSTDLGDDFEFEGRVYPARTPIPTMVPTQTPEAVKYMQNMKPGQGWDRSISMEKQILDTATVHAHMRIRQGKNPFYIDGEES